MHRVASFAHIAHIAHFAKLLRTTRLVMYFGQEKTWRKVGEVLAKLPRVLRQVTSRYIKNSLNTCVLHRVSAVVDDATA